MEQTDLYICRSCGITKPPAAYSPSQLTARGGPQCRECNNLYLAEYRRRKRLAAKSPPCLPAEENPFFDSGTWAKLIEMNRKLKEQTGDRIDFEE
ncbi:hypothetical protein V9W64_10635 [Neisseria leonii]|uniref:Uncharacterized protein n=1 Tax=Neisseria leonii TaxID=2995413 RepID=A0A9X4E375_9NEIS|nr:hypothetical protein [Neisseria sp. 51.81]MDD9328792.1 hypothetical protein [Neisseria sp. 51.81]